MLRSSLFYGSSIVFVSVKIPFLIHQNSFIVTILKWNIYTKFYAVIVCRVYKGSVRFNTIATAFKKHEKILSL